MNNKGSGSGCLTGILVFSAIAGNIFLFSGDLGSGGDLEGNSIAIIMVLIAIIADIALIGYFISAWIKSSERKQEEKEKQRISEMTQKVNELIARYSPCKAISLQRPQLIRIDNAIVNTEVVFTVNQFKERIRDSISECNAIDQKLTRILACNGCQTVDEKFNFLSEKTEELQSLKNDSDRLHNELSKHKIKLLNEDGNLLFFVKKAFSALLSSKKCVIEGISLKELICEGNPLELSFFDYKYAPATLHIGKNYFCLFSHLIIVFDENGVFVSAIDPTALDIKVERISADVWINNNTLPSHQYIDVDSKCIAQGDTRHTWVHTCRDGSPDLRYSYNPRIEYRTDKYEYGKVEITILGNKVSLYLSSDVATKALERVNREYIRKCNNRHNPIPEFLNLISRVSEEGDGNITYIFDTNKLNGTAGNYFCSIN